MRSAAKLSYQQAQAAIDGKPDDTTGPILEPILRPLWAAYATLAKARDQRGPSISTCLSGRSSSTSTAWSATSTGIFSSETK